MSCRARLLVSALLGALAVAAPAPAARAGEPQSPDQLELTARTHFAASEYQEALEIYARLYAITLHPTYLRNIGRCYQNLGQADKAVSSFREYLRKARNLDERGRAEVEQYIREMEALSAKQASQAKPAPGTAQSPAKAAPAATPRAPGEVAPVKLAAPAPPEDEHEGPAAKIASTPGRDDGAEASPVYKRWWFWTLLVVAAGGAATAVVLSRGDSTPSASTTLGTMRPQ